MTINAEGGGRTGLVYNAEPDGSNVTSPLGDIAGGGASGSGGGAKSPQEIAECVQQAGTDISKIQACTQ